MKRMLAAGCVSFGLVAALANCEEDASAPGTPLNLDAATPVIDSGAAGPTDASTIEDASTPEDAEASAPPLPPPPRCRGDQLQQLVRPLSDGGTFAETVDQQSVAYIPDAPWRILNSLKGQGYEYFRGVGAGPAPRFTSEERPFEFGMLRTGNTSPTPNGVYCWGNGGVAQKQVDGPLTLRTSVGKYLGQCPGGTPIAGEVTLCSANNPLCTAPVTGSLTGVTLDGTNLRLSGDAVSLPSFGVNGFGGQLILFAWTDAQPAGGEVRLLTSGVFATLPTATSPGGIYCAGAGSVVGWATATGTYVTIKNATKLGDCGGPPTISTGNGNESCYLCRY